jgi:hypothetical protein
MRDKMSHAIPDIISWDGMMKSCMAQKTQNALWEFQNLRENLQETWVLFEKPTIQV